MRVLLQRVSDASVTVEGETVGQIGAGLLVLLGVSRDDDEGDARYIADKTVNLRIFADNEGKFNRSALETGAELLIVSQFTLYGDTRKGRRPSFISSAATEQAEPLFNRTVEMFEESGLVVQTGRFQANMTVGLNNDGPVTIMLDSADRQRPRKG